MELEEAHGPGNLLMLEGRARLAGGFLQFARSRQHAAPGAEPKLALAIGAYAREHPVVAVPADGDVIDLGTPEDTAPRQPLRDAADYRLAVTAVGAGTQSGR